MQHASNSLLRYVHKKVQLNLPRITTKAISTPNIFDAKGLVYKAQLLGAATLGEMALKYNKLITVHCHLNDCGWVNVVFDQWFSLSLKMEKRKSDIRNTSLASEGKIQEQSTHIHNQ